MKKIRPLLSTFLFVCMGIGNIHAQNPVTVSGVVTSADANEPLIGVSVVAGPDSGVITGIDGSYSIRVEPRTTLAFQFIGYQTRHFTVPQNAEQVVYNVRLETDSQLIDDVVVIAYGERKKGTIAGSVGTVKAAKINDTPTASFDQALQGQVPGLTVISNSGEPGRAASFQIRGANSINAGTAPLFILDGIPISSADFNAISPADIESITVLKDAASTSIYGARAANGVLVITTKRGTGINRKAQVRYRMQLGFSQLAQGKWNLMNTAERIQYEKEVGLTAGKDYERLAKTDVNWLDEIFSSFAPLQSYELQVTGASERFNYFISGGYYDQQGTTNDSKFSRFNFRANAEARVNNWLKVGTNTMMAYEEIKESMSGEYSVVTPISASRFMLPYISPYRADGSLASVNDGSWEGTGQNPLEWVEYNPYLAKKYKVISALTATATPMRGLTLKSQLGLDYTHTTALSKALPSYRPQNGLGSAGRSTGDAMNLSISNTINYNFSRGGAHHFNFMVGQEGNNYYYEGFSVGTAGQTNDFLTNLSSGTRATSWPDSGSGYAFASFFGRAEYNYKSRYYVEASARTDGSSRFGSGHRWAGFWSVGGMWDIRNEDFLQNYGWLTNFQLSASIGTSGNASIGNYDHLALVTGTADYMGNAGLSPASKGNPNIGWEEVLAANIALKLGFWNRLNVEVEFYNKKTYKMLMAVPVSYADGGGGFRWDNIGAIRGRGAEVSINADVVRYRDFTWSVNGNVSYNSTIVTALYNGIDEYVDSNTGFKLTVGRPLREFFYNRYAGVNPANGDALWLDKDGNLTNEFRESDKVLLGKSPYAPWVGGFGTTLNWKGISLTAQFSWVEGRWMVNNDRYFEESGGLFDAYNQSKRMLYDRWKKPGDIASIPRHGVSPQFDTRLLEDASFLRLKNLMLSYSFPAGLLDKTHFLSGTRVYVQAQNLLTFTRFSGLDPETTTNMYKAQYPASRQFTFGLELTF